MDQAILWCAHPVSLFEHHQLITAHVGNGNFHVIAIDFQRQFLPVWSKTGLRRDFTISTQRYFYLNRSQRLFHNFRFAAQLRNVVDQMNHPPSGRVVTVALPNDGSPETFNSGSGSSLERTFAKSVRRSTEASS